MDDAGPKRAATGAGSTTPLGLGAALDRAGLGDDIVIDDDGGGFGDGTARFHALVHNSFDAIVVSDHENVITYATPSIRTLFGYDPDELVGVNGFSFLHPSDRADSIDNARQLLARPGSATLQTFRLRHAAGGYRWVECTSVNLLDHRHVHGILNTFRDITDRKEAEDSVRESEERLRALLMNADGAILVVDTDGRVQWSSPLAPVLWGLDGESMLGRTVTELIHRDDRAEVVRQFKKLAGGALGATVRLEARMRHGDGSWRWYESIFTNRLDDPTIEGIVSNVRDTTERAMHEQALRHSEARLEYQATHDPLTELPNRTLLQDRMLMAVARARRNDSALAVLFCDLDHFKFVNDSQGHSIGDALLRDVAARLGAAARQGDTVARFGGDEFVVLSEDLRSIDDALAITAKLQSVMTSPFRINGVDTYVTMSIGVSYADAPEQLDGEALLRDADAAMYQAKALGRARVEIFDDAMRARAIDRHHIEASLRRAVRRRQLQVHFQPVVDMRTGAVAGTEALVRWKHPTRGLLYPGTFIAIAEDTGLVVPLGAWVLDQACAQTELWQHADIGGDDLFVAVNLSARQLADPSLIDDIASVLSATDLDPDHLHLEITESVIMQDVDASKDLLDRLKVLGVRIAIDDFGTGYSSFSYLLRFPVDILKIDRSFVAGIEADSEADAIVEAITNLGHTLGLEVVAEGVETTGQYERLRELGCDQAQGYLLGRPLPAAGLHDVLADPQLIRPA